MQDIQKYPTVTSLQIQQADPGLEKNKKSIYNHPLYPLLALLLEQCEQATCSPDSQAPDTFEADLLSYTQRHEDRESMFFSENKDLDSLIVKAIQVLRIHINELRKVNELCRDFCTRYINCLKTKIHQDSMFDDSEASSPSCSDRLSPNLVPGSNSAYNSPYSLPGASLVRNYLELGQNHRVNSLHNMGHNCSSTINGITVDCSDYINSGSSPPPLSSMSINEEMNNKSYLTSSANSGAYGTLLDSKQKRGVLPKKATQIMKQWLFQHLVHPYPTEDEKRQIANQTNLTLLQVNNWFINARRRILQPMLETSASPGKDKSSNGQLKVDRSDSVSESEDTASGFVYSSSCANRKKKASTSRPSNNRFWPASLATAVTILSTHPPNNSSPITAVASDLTTTKSLLQSKPTDHGRTRKRPTTDSPDTDTYQPPKLFASSKESYDAFVTDVDLKSHQKSPSQTPSTPRYTELSSPNNSKTNSPIPSEITANQYNNRRISPHLQDHKTQDKSNVISSYLSSVTEHHSPNHDAPPTSIFPMNSCAYVPSNPYSNIMMPQTNPYLNHPAMFYNASLNRSVQSSDSNSMSSALFGIRHPNSHSFPMYETMYPSHINDLFTVPHGFPLPWEDSKPGNNSMQIMDSLSESGQLSYNPYSHLDLFPNFKAFQSKTNTN